MRNLHRKLWRDLRRQWSPCLSIAAVVACAVGAYLTPQATADALTQARDDFYAQARFADLFASARRAPVSLRDTVAVWPEVQAVAVRVEGHARLQIGRGAQAQPEPLTAHLVGLSAQQPSPLNRVLLRGFTPNTTPASPGPRSGDARLPVWVSEAFADVHRLRTGDTLTALVNGRQLDLVMTGRALGPDAIFAGGFGMPDPRGYAVLWIDEAVLAGVLDLRGAFNHLSLTLRPGARAEPVLERLRGLLRPYGGREPNTREHQTSHAMLDNEITEQRLIGTLLPLIFFGVAAFLLQVVISRWVAAQREIIATLKALGYGTGALLAHYGSFVGLTVAAGIVLGTGLGQEAAQGLAGLYRDFFRFPQFEVAVRPALVLQAAAGALGVALVASAQAVWQAVSGPTAAALQPPSPGRYRPTLIERHGGTLGRALPLSARLVLRNLERHRWRSAMSVLGTAAAVAIVVLGHFFADSIEVLVDQQFQQALRGDVMLRLNREQPAPAVQQELMRQGPVLRVEATREVPVRLVVGGPHGARSARVALRGVEPRAELNQLVDAQGQVRRLPLEGLVLSERLAAKLGLRVGDAVRAEVLDGREPVLDLRVHATVSDTMGLNAWMPRAALNQALGEGDVANALSLRVMRGQEDALIEHTRHLPLVAGAWSKARLLQNMQDISARNVRIMSSVMTAFAAVMAVGVVYNTARVAWAERAWELASLRVLGCTRGEVGAWLLGEWGLLILLALPLGLVLGAGLVQGLVHQLQSDQFQFPVVIGRSTVAWAVGCTSASAAFSALIIHRRIRQLDLVAALKVRE